MVIGGGKKIRSTIIFDAGKIFNLSQKNLLMFAQVLNVFIHIL